VVSLVAFLSLFTVSTSRTYIADKAQLLHTCGFFHNQNPSIKPTETREQAHNILPYKPFYPEGLIEKSEDYYSKGGLGQG